MKWVDYREKLGIGFNNEQKFEKLKNILMIWIDTLEKNKLYCEISLRRYMLMVGEHINYSYDIYNGLRLSFGYTINIHELISKYIAFCNTYNAMRDPQNYSKIYEGKDMAQFITNQLTQLNIPFEVIKDNDGYFIFPKGAKEFDEALVSQPLEWLKGYPLAYKAFVKALKDYSSAIEDNASEVADSLRKALETFFQGFFKGTKSLENYKSEYGDYLKSHGVPTELANDFTKLLGAFTDYNNNYAKHHDKASLNVLEYLLYQTGNIIRLLITLKNGEIT